MIVRHFAAAYNNLGLIAVDEGDYKEARAMFEGALRPEDDLEDKRLLSNVIGCPWEDVKVGMPVRVIFEDVTPEMTLPKFVPSPSGRGRG